MLTQFHRVSLVTRVVSNILVRDFGGHENLMGLCAIGACVVAARLLRQGIRAELCEGFNDLEGHAWAEVDGLVADPTFGQFYCDSEYPVSWYVGEHQSYHTDWDNIGSPAWNAWPDGQRPDGERGRKYLSDEDLCSLGIWPKKTLIMRAKSQRTKVGKVCAPRQPILYG